MTQAPTAATACAHARMRANRIVHRPECSGRTVVAIGGTVTISCSIPRTRRERHGIVFSGAIFVVGARTAAVVPGIQFDSTDPASVTNVFAVAHQLVGAIRVLGYGRYRARPDSMDLAADRYSYSDHAHRRFVEEIEMPSIPTAPLPGRARHLAGETARAPEGRAGGGTQAAWPAPAAPGRRSGSVPWPRG